MLPPLLHLLATQPSLLAEHAQAYAELISQEFAATTAFAKRQAILYVAMLCLASVSLVFVGMAVLAWAVVPVERMHLPWALVLLPVPTALAAVACMLAARQVGRPRGLGEVARQVKADWVILRQAGQG